jgi:hypothetical protein
MVKAVDEMHSSAIARLGVFVNPLEVARHPCVHTGKIQLCAPVLVVRAPAPKQFTFIKEEYATGRISVLAILTLFAHCMVREPCTDFDIVNYYLVKVQCFANLPNFLPEFRKTGVKLCNMRF